MAPSCRARQSETGSAPHDRPPPRTCRRRPAGPCVATRPRPRVEVRGEPARVADQGDPLGLAVPAAVGQLLGMGERHDCLARAGAASDLDPVEKPGDLEQAQLLLGEPVGLRLALVCLRSRPRTPAGSARAGSPRSGRCRRPPPVCGPGPGARAGCATARRGPGGHRGRSPSTGGRTGPQSPHRGPCRGTRRRDPNALRCGRTRPTGSPSPRSAARRRWP